jgi:DNA helicase-2/ATP-dependent DNA helicase PcrA
LAADDAEEAATIAGQIQDVGPPWSEIAVLCRKRRQLIPVIVRALESLEIPVTVAGSSGLLDRPEVVDLVSWLEILAGDAPVALLRILRGPRARIGWRDLAALARHGDLPGALGALDDVIDLGAEARLRLTAFGEQRAALAAAAARVPVVELAERIIERTGLWPDAGPKGRENLLRFLDLAEHFSPVDGDADLRSFVEYLHLLDGSDEDVAEATSSGQDAVAVMTIHQAKGLEFANVWVPGLAGKGSSTIFPDNRSAENPLTQTAALPWWVRPDPSNLPTWSTARSMTEVADLLRQRNLEEEWRLFYVACTRAERRLTLSAAHWYPGPVTPQGPSSFYEFVAGQHDLVTELFRHGPAATDPAIAAMERRRDDQPRAGSPTTASPTTAPAVLFPDEVDHAPAPVPAPRPVPVALSVTSLVSYARCPRQFYWSVVRPLPRRPSPAAQIGVEVHRRIELRASRQLRLLEPEPAPSSVPGEWGEAAPSTAEALEASFMLSPFADLDPVRVEAPFVLAVGGRLVRGRVDAVYSRDGKVELVDFKTGRRPATGDGGATTQLDLYALAAVQAWREDPASLRTTFCYLRADGPAELDSSDWDAGRLEAVKQQLEAALARLPSEDFAAVAGAWCRRCDFAEVCPAGRQSMFVAQP